jgi:hypothetical protein
MLAARSENDFMHALGFALRSAAATESINFDVVLHGEALDGVGVFNATPSSPSMMGGLTCPKKSSTP